MSAEGDHNLDNDSAADHMAQISDGLFRRVVDLLQHQRGHEYDDDEIGELFVRIEMIFALHDRNMIVTAPPFEEISGLVAPYIARWEDYHRSAGHDPPAARHTSMRETFEKLLAITKDIESRRSELRQVPLDENNLSDDEKTVLDILNSVERKAEGE